MKGLRIALLLPLLAACSLIPTPTQPPKQTVQAPVMAAADTGQKPPEKVTFPNMVKTTPLAAPETPELDEVSALLQAFQAENGSFTTASEKNKEPKAAPSPESHRDDDHEDHKAWVVELKSKEAKGKRQIRIPETGEFKLVLETGPRFEITDRDARDGEAKIQMPAATLKTWVHLEEARDNSSLEVSDELYYVKDTLSKERQHKHHDDERAKQWFKLGLRPMPVPSDWYSPDGQAFVLRFKANQIKEFQMIWQKQRGQAPFPPGINKIGPEGGDVELPGVGTLKLLPGALEQPLTIAMRQVLEIRKPTYEFPSIQLDYISSIVKIEPIFQNLKTPGGEIVLNTDLKRLGNNSAGLLDYIYTKEPEISPAWKRISTRTPKSIKDFDNYPVDLPGLIGTFGYFVRVIDQNIKPTDGGYTLPPDDLSFGIKSIYDNILDKHAFRRNPCQIRVSDGSFKKEKAQRIKNYCNEIFGYYVTLLDKAGASHYPQLLFDIPNFYMSSEKGYLKVEIRKGLALTELSIFSRGSSDVYLPSSYDKEYPCDTCNYAEVVAHELWHVFQHADLLNGGYGDSAAIYGGEKEWLYEGSAQYMGASTMKKIPFSPTPAKYYAYDYERSTKRGIASLSNVPFYEFSQNQGGKDYRSSAFFTYLSNPSTYLGGDIIMAKIASYYSENKPNNQFSDIVDLASVISTEFKEHQTTKTLRDHFFKYAHFAISKERLDLFPKETMTILDLPSPMNTLQLLSGSSTEFDAKWIIGNNNFTPYKKNHQIKSLSANYYRFYINKKNRSSRKFAIKIKAKSTTPSKFRFSALMYKDIEQAPSGNKGFEDNKYALPPDARLGSDSLGIHLFTQNGKPFILTQEFNEKYQAIILVAAAIDFLDREFRSFDIEISFQAMGTRTSTLDLTRTAVIEPDKPTQIADSSGNLPDPLLWDQLPKLVIHKVPGCMKENCKMAFEHISGGPEIIVKVPPEKIIDEEIDSDGVTLQKISAIIPNDAKHGGQVRVLSDDIEIEAFGVTPVSCNSIQKTSTYNIQALRSATNPCAAAPSK